MKEFQKVEWGRVGEDNYYVVQLTACLLCVNVVGHFQIIPNSCATHALLSVLLNSNTVSYTHLTLPTMAVV